jgi:hypothetical protein
MAFRSGLEEKVADLLTNLGVKYEYESTKVPYVLQCNYTPDFLLPNGVYLETKGHLTDEDRRKMKAVKAANPDLDVRFVFQSPFNKIYKTTTVMASALAVTITSLVTDLIINHRQNNE